MDGRNWKKCPNGHVLGEIVREPVVHEGRRAYATRLRVYRQAVADVIAVLDLVDVVAVLEGTAPEIHCSICGAKATWVIGQAETDRLVARWVTRKGGHER